MASPTCERFRDDLSAFADRTLAPRRWDQVAYHLAGCPDCRSELAAINAVCSELKRCRAADPSDTLAARLESIAGEIPEAPLYMASGVGDLPSARRTRSRRVAQGSVAALVVMMSAVVIAVLIAPEPARLTNAVKAAREQFSMASSAISVSDAIGRCSSPPSGAPTSVSPSATNPDPLTVPWRPSATPALRRCFCVPRSPNPASPGCSASGSRTARAGTAPRRSAPPRSQATAQSSRSSTRGRPLPGELPPVVRVASGRGPDGWSFSESVAPRPWGAHRAPPHRLAGWAPRRGLVVRHRDGGAAVGRALPADGRRLDGHRVQTVELRDGDARPLGRAADRPAACQAG
ncbi:hypothetical protein G7085_15695 [Tessaracoccus sp. HDW20]|nr:hypothetical protein [Tessaracoccus coleopterorum]